MGNLVEARGFGGRSDGRSDRILPRGGWLSLDRQFALGLTAFAGATVLTGAATRYRGRRERSRRYSVHTRPDGTLVEFDLHRPAGASRAVLLEGGLGFPHEYWDWISSAFPQDVAFIKFNRPGYGLSTPVQNRDLTAHFSLLDELRADYLRDLPVTLVGHSLGGYLLAAYASFHRGATDGVDRLVMIDATNVRQLREGRGGETDLWFRQTLLMERCYSAAGLSALVPAMNRLKTFKPEINRSSRAFFAHKEAWVTAYREYTAAADHPEPDPESIEVPLTVVTAQDNQGSNSDHLAVQAEFLKYATQSQHHVIPGSSHESLLVYRPHAEEVSRIIADPGHRTETTEEGGAQ
jgi:pimeloyl-ACP methyl ester carboxylesterase